MRALTIRQPWAWAVEVGAKTVENRSWSTSYRGWLAIHAAARHDPDGVLDWNIRDAQEKWTGRGRVVGLPPWDERAQIIALVDLVDCHWSSLAVACSRPRHECRPWGRPRVYHWVFGDVIRLVTPVPCRGRQGLWTVPDDIAARIAAA